MAVAATGFFDGVHIGHRLVIETLVRAARERGEESLIVTFWPHPRIVLQDEALSLRLLNTMEEKLSLLKGLGVDRIEVLPFTREFSTVTAREFLSEYVRNRFGVDSILIGYDNRFGGDGLNTAQTGQVARELGLNVIQTEKVSQVGLAVSSTKIRTALTAGDVELAARFLCYDYSLSGTVVEGNRLGRKLGFPTANMGDVDTLKLVPAAGVYLADVEVAGRMYRGMTNIGYRPTLGSGNRLTVETHIFDFDEDIYGQPIRASFRKRIRDEVRFDSLEELSSQLAQDRLWCKNFLSAEAK